MLLAACSKKRSADIGVDVFSVDTMPRRIYVHATGTLEIGLRADQIYSSAKSLTLGTPATLIIHKGAGTARILSVDSTQRIAVQPLGVPPDSAEKVGVTGRVVRLTRVGEERQLKLEVERP